MEPTYDVVWPKSPMGVHARRPAQRLTDLRGTRIGFVWDYLFRGEEIFPAVERELRARFEGVDIVGYDVFGNIHGPHEADLVRAIPETLRAHRVDGVIVGNGC